MSLVGRRFKIRDTRNPLSASTTFLVLAACLLAFLDRAAADDPGFAWNAAGGGFNEFEVVVDEPSGRESAMPLKGGVPFPQGTLNDPSQIRLVDSEGNEVPAQVDVAARYPDQSLRWVLLSFHASPAERFWVEFGPGVSRSASPSIQYGQRVGGGWQVDTGVARFLFNDDELLIDEILLKEEGGEERTVLSGGGSGAYLVDNQGRRATVRGEAAEMESELLVEGGHRVTVRREGFYVTEEGEPLARGVARFSFYGGSSEVRVSHTLILTRDTNEVWFKEYGLDFPLNNEGNAEARFDLSRSSAEDTIFEVTLAPGETASMLQETFPHFLNDDQRFLIRKDAEEAAEILLENDVAGDWADFAAETAGFTVVLPELAEQFPKEISVRTDGVRLALWAGAAGKELDFRAETLVEEYWGEWAKNPMGRTAPSAEELREMSSDAQGSARTHEFWLLPRGASGELDSVVERADSFRQTALVHAEPAWVTHTEAMGWPLHPYDPEAYPEEERMIGEFWERTLLSQEVFPMTGFIAWGVQPYLQWHEADGRWRPGFYRLSHIIEYGLRERAWNLYARSGDRRYADWGKRFNRFIYDWGMHHWDTGNKFAGGFSQGRTHTPFYWGTGSTTLRTQNSGHSIQNFLSEYFMTGNELALEAVRSFGEAVKEDWDPTVNLAHPGMAVRVLVSLYTLDWDEDFAMMTRTLAREQLIDLESPNAVNLELDQGRPLRKVHRNAFAFYEYYWATGDPAGREAFLKIIDYELDHNRLPVPVAYQNAGAFLLALAYQLSDDPRYLRASNAMVEAGLAQESTTIEEDLEFYGGIMGGRPGVTRGVHTNMHPMLGMPTALAVMGRATDPIQPFAWAIGSSSEASSVAVATAGEPVELQFFVQTFDGEEPEITVKSLDGEAVDGAAIDIVEAPLEPFPPSAVGRRDFQVYITIAGAPAPVVVIGFRTPDEYVLLETSTPDTALFAPAGAWTGFNRRMAELLPLYFMVPEGTETLEIFLNHPQAWLRRPDGSEVFRPDPDGETGLLEVPVENQYGLWSFQSVRPVYFQLRNVPPVLLPTPAESDLIAAYTDWADRPEPIPTEFPEDLEAGLVEIDGEGALQLPTGAFLKFPRGEALEEEGGFQHFPSEQGTIEFWFKPNWSSQTLTSSGQSIETVDWFESDAVRLFFRYGVGHSSMEPYSHLYLSTQGEDGPTVTTPIRRGNYPAWLRADRWHHLAATWEIEDREGESRVGLTIYIDGEPVAPTYHQTVRNGFTLQDPEEELRLGFDLNAAIRHLRISNSLRYTDAFDPDEIEFVPDDQTRIYFPLLEDLSGVTGDEQTIEAVLNP